MAKNENVTKFSSLVVGDLFIVCNASSFPEDIFIFGEDPEVFVKTSEDFVEVNIFDQEIEVPLEAFTHGINALGLQGRSGHIFGPDLEVELVDLGLVSAKQ